MTSLLLGLILAAPPSDALSVDTDQPRAYHEINQDIRKWMARESRAQTPDERSTAVQSLADLYLELKNDPRLDEAPTLKQYKAKVWSRLTRIKKTLQARIEREQSKTHQNRQPDEFQAEQIALSDANRAAESLAAQMSLVSSSLGGPSTVFAQAGGGDAFGGGAVRDDGAALVELITRVIEPDFWDVNGGPGTIFYYAPVRALVVRATSEVHHKLGGGLRGLRAVP